MEQRLNDAKARNELAPTASQPDGAITGFGLGWTPPPHSANGDAGPSNIVG